MNFSHHNQPKNKRNHDLLNYTTDGTSRSITVEEWWGGLFRFLLGYFISPRVSVSAVMNKDTTKLKKINKVNISRPEVLIVQEILPIQTRKTTEERDNKHVRTYV